jgi:hypothetical protein
VTQYTRADLAMADRHVSEGERHIIGQEVLLTRLRLLAAPTEDAESLLALLNSTQAAHRAHRVAIAEALAAGGL